MLRMQNKRRIAHKSRNVNERHTIKHKRRTNEKIEVPEKMIMSCVCEGVQPNALLTDGKCKTVDLIISHYVGYYPAFQTCLKAN